MLSENILAPKPPISTGEEIHRHIMAAPTPEEAVLFETRGKVAIITLNIEKKLNAMTQDYYFRVSQLLREVAKMDDIYITVLTGKGRFFSA